MGPSIFLIADLLWTMVKILDEAGPQREKIYIAEESSEWSKSSSSCNKDEIKN